MVKFANDIVLDALLDKVSTATQLLVVPAQPTARADAISSALASVNVTSAAFSKADGTTSGRKLTVAQQVAVPVTATGSATHVALVDGANLLYVTTVTPQTLTSGNTVTVPAWTITIADPS